MKVTEETVMFSLMLALHDILKYYMDDHEYSHFMSIERHVLNILSLYITSVKKIPWHPQGDMVALASKPVKLS